MTDAKTPAWPERPTCHDNDHRTQAPFSYGKPEWRPAASRGFRSCSFCGCIHPEDLIQAVKDGSKLEMADWKYGWPHKLYVSGGKVGHAKFYTEHLLEMSPEAQDVLLPVLSNDTGIQFFRDERGIGYKGVPPNAV